MGCACCTCMHVLLCTQHDEQLQHVPAQQDGCMHACEVSWWLLLLSTCSATHLFKLLGQQQARTTPCGIKVHHNGLVSAGDGCLQLLCVHLPDVCCCCLWSRRTSGSRQRPPQAFACAYRRAVFGSYRKPGQPRTSFDCWAPRWGDPGPCILLRAAQLTGLLVESDHRVKWRNERSRGKIFLIASLIWRRGGVIRV